MQVSPRPAASARGALPRATMRREDSEIDSVELDTVRQFNRFYSTVLAGLNEHLVDTEYSLTEVRVLFALYTQESPNPSALRHELRLDAGYLSRILRRFETEGLLERSRSDVDGRRHELNLTRDGLTKAQLLYTRADDVLVEMLSHLDAGERSAITAAMESIHSVLGRHKEPWRPAVP